MHFESRPAWRYQWPTLIASMALFVLVAMATIYGPGPLTQLGARIVCAVAGALALYLALLVLYRRLAWRYVIDDHNIESYHGVLARHVHSIRIRDLRNVSVNQSIVQRVLGVGDVEFSSAAGQNVEVIFFGVPDPMQIKQLAQRLQAEPAQPLGD